MLANLRQGVAQAPRNDVSAAVMGLHAINTEVALGIDGAQQTVQHKLQEQEQERRELAAQEQEVRRLQEQARELERGTRERKRALDEEVAKTAKAQAQNLKPALEKAAVQEATYNTAVQQSPNTLTQVGTDEGLPMTDVELAAWHAQHVPAAGGPGVPAAGGPAPNIGRPDKWSEFSKRCAADMPLFIKRFLTWAALSKTPLQMIPPTLHMQVDGPLAPEIEAVRKSRMGAAVPWTWGPLVKALLELSGADLIDRRDAALRAVYNRPKQGERTVTEWGVHVRSLAAKAGLDSKHACVVFTEGMTADLLADCATMPNGKVWEDLEAAISYARGQEEKQQAVQRMAGGKSSSRGRVAAASALPAPPALDGPALLAALKEQIASLLPGAPADRPAGRDGRDGRGRGRPQMFKGQNLKYMSVNGKRKERDEQERHGRDERRRDDGAGPSNMAGVQCHLCKGFGHFARACPHRR